MYIYTYRYSYVYAQTCQFDNTNIRIYHRFDKPFDRHDWYVDRCGKSVRYVIDYYDDPSQNDDLQVKIDARPALDSFQAVRDRVRMFFSTKN